MKEIFREELIAKLRPYIKGEQLEDVKLQISIILAKYDVTRIETAIQPYEGDVNTEMIKRFIIAKVARGCTPRTINYYKTTLLQFFAKIGKTYSQVTADDIRLYIATRTQIDGISKTTANNERRNISSFYAWLQKEEILLKNPMAKIEPLKKEYKKKKAFTKMEIEKLRAGCRTTRELAEFEILLSTWARVSEVAQIRIDDIREDKITVHGKGQKDREVYLTPKAQLSIEKYLQERSDNNPYLFPRSRQDSGNIFMKKGKLKRSELPEWYKHPEYVGEGCVDHGTIEWHMRNLGKRTGVENVHPHKFRRTGATMALKNGMPLITVSKMLGHANLGTTQIYLDISDEEMAEAHNRYAI